MFLCCVQVKGGKRKFDLLKKSDWTLHKTEQALKELTVC